jgi:deoxyribose-phosphate aldolase
MTYEPLGSAEVEEIIESLRPAIRAAVGAAGGSLDTRLPGEAAAPLSHPGAEQITGLIDHTLLRPDATPAQIEILAQEAIEHGFACVCVNPAHVALAVLSLDHSRVRVAAVAGFPLGANLTETKVLEAVRAIGQGAQEIDLVMSIGALIAGDHQSVAEDLRAVAQAVHREGGWLKVIIESALLSLPRKVAACLLATCCGADFVKTSTGFGPGGARVEDVRLIRQVVGPSVGVKAAGGIRSLEDALAMIEAGANRLGTSSGVAIARQLAGIPMTAEQTTAVY